MKLLDFPFQLLAAGLAIRRSNAVAVSCPASNNTIYTSANNNRFIVECGFDRPANDVAGAFTDNYEACLEYCTLNMGCLTVAFTGNACYMRNIINPPRYDNTIWGGRLISTISCPASNNTIYVTRNGARYVIECGFNRSWGDISSLRTDSYESCLEVCTQTPGCLDVSFTTDTCWLKNVLNPPLYHPNVWGGRLLPGTISCPTSNNTMYTTTSGNRYVVECGIDRLGNEFHSFYAKNYDACVEGCSRIVGCFYATFVDNTCHISNIAKSPVYNNTIWGGRLVTGTPLPPGVSTLDCMVDPPSRALPYLSQVSGVAPWNCAVGCRKLGYRYAGIEYGSECWCGSTRPVVSTVYTDCNMPCSDNLPCGGANRLSVTMDNNVPEGTIRQSYKSWTVLSCYSDVTTARTLATSLITPAGPKNMTNADCLNICSNQDFTYCGTEHGGECYGSNTQPAQVRALAGDPIQQGCYYPCTGKVSELCGGSDRIIVYEVNTAARV
ncbi:hypothetical protein K461DRAFT_290519 [Myriangium duriaei CBS 260.36]|uniref:WSC domain-containing protein n=1 Tax=Myriangium duriaei CBS 260.36 TaxID=1168546 RepID=A0A9P4J5J7_9PEZI|nr:hypothetical protein K461DRAFT_290519 [Myriangium duriaei CBS 260.36]